MAKLDVTFAPVWPQRTGETGEVSEFDTSIIQKEETAFHHLGDVMVIS